MHSLQSSNRIDEFSIEIEEVARSSQEIFVHLLVRIGRRTGNDS